MTLFPLFDTFRALAGLPALLRTQRRLERRIAGLGTAIEDEKLVRKQMDALLAEAGLARNAGVLCRGFNVIRRGQKGRSALNTDVLVEKLVVLGLAREAVAVAIAGSTEDGTPSTWAEVQPAKGAAVRTP